MRRQPGAVSSQTPGHEQLAWSWATFNGSGTPALLDSRNISSITDTAAGIWTLNFTYGYRAATFAVGVCGLATGTTAATVAAASLSATGLTTGGMAIETANTSDTGIDSTIVSATAVGAL